MSTAIQRSFSGGEIAPSLYSRVDLVKYATGLRTCRNFIIQKHGGATNRPGVGFICEVKDSTKTVRLLPFEFNSDQTYVLEFGNLYMRVIRNQAPQTDTNTAITAATQANPCVITSVAHGLTTGDEVQIASVLGMTQLNGRNFKVTVLTADTISLQLMDGSTNLNSTGYGAYTSAGTVKRVYTLTTPYLEADLQTLEIDQSADIITITHPNYAPRELARTGHTSWTLTVINFLPSVSRPTGASGTAGGAGANTYRYKITAVDRETFKESLGALNTTTRTITAITQANPAVVTSNAHGFANGDIVHITAVVGMTQVNDLEFEVANVAANTFQLRGIDSTAYTAYSSAGSANRVSIVLTAAAAPTTGAPHVLTWTALSGAGEYDVYKEQDGVYGFIGVAGSTTFNDTGFTPDTADNAPYPRNPFLGTGNFPSTSGYYQQRHVFANTDNDTEKVWMSKSGDFKNMTTSSPLQDDDSVTFNLAGKQVNEVRHIIDLDGLIIFTDGAEWAILGDADGVVTPGVINPRAKSYYGSHTVAPLIIGSTILFVQHLGIIIRDLFNDTIEGYKGNDLTIFSTHLFENYTIRDWAYQKTPHSIAWVVRSDGKLLGLTYIREHQFVAWHKHDFDGTVEQVCSVSEGSESAVYLVIKRTIDGSEKRYIERFKNRIYSDLIDAVFLDCSLTYDGRNTNAAHNMTLSGGATWEYTETLTLTSSTAYFTAADVGNQIFLTGADGGLIRFTIEAYSSTTVVTGRPHKTVPTSLRSTATATWSRAVDQVGGLWYLEGKEVGVFADKFVVANPNNDSYDVVTVSNGVVSLEKPYAVIHVGLPITADMETLDIDSLNGETLVDKNKLITGVVASVESSRGIWIGGETPTSDSDFKIQLVEAKLRENETLDDPVELKTGTIPIKIKSHWNSNGRVFIRQTDPIPLAVLAISPSGHIPFK